MVDKIAEQDYINAVMAKLPEVKAQKVHVLKGGDNLWNLAKKELNKKDASNQEISNYMLLIAKLNKLNTIEKMNNLKINDKIYLPGNAVKVDNIQQLSASEKTVNALINVLKNDKTLSVKKADLDLPNVDLYHVFKQNPKYANNYFLKEKNLYSFKVDKKSGKISSLIVNDNEKRVHKLWFDYIIHANGNVNDGQLSNKLVEKLSQEQTKQLFGETEKLLNQYKKSK